MATLAVIPKHNNRIQFQVDIARGRKIYKSRDRSRSSWKNRDKN